MKRSVGAGPRRESTFAIDAFPSVNQIVVNSSDAKRASAETGGEGRPGGEEGAGVMAREERTLKNENRISCAETQCEIVLFFLGTNGPA